MPLSSLKGVVQTRDFTELDSGRYEFLSLDQAEPNLGIPNSDQSLLLSDVDGTRTFTTFPTLSGLVFKPNSLEQVSAGIPQYFLVLKDDPTDGVADSVGWSLGSFEETDTLQLVTERGNTTTQDVTVANLNAANLFADSAVFSGGVLIQGNLIVNGEQTTINSTTLTVDDKNIVIAQGAVDAISADGAGITVDGVNATIQYTGATDRWAFNKDLDINSVFVGDNIVFDGDSAQQIIKLTNDLNVQSTNLNITDVSGSQTFASFSNGAISINEVLTITDSANMQGKLFFTDVPPKDGINKVLFRRISDGLIMEGEIDEAALGFIDQVKTEDTDSDDTHYLLFTYANGGAGGFDSAYIDTSELTYNPSTNTLTLQNLVANGLTDLDSTTVEGDIQIKSTGIVGSGRLLDSAGRSFVIYDSSGALLWGNNGVSANNLGGSNAGNYVPSTPSDWTSPAPTTTIEAIDRLASLIKTLNGGTGA